MWRGKIQTEIERSRREGQKEGKQMEVKREDDTAKGKGREEWMKGR